MSTNTNLVAKMVKAYGPYGMQPVGDDAYRVAVEATDTINEMADRLTDLEGFFIVVSTHEETKDDYFILPVESFSEYVIIARKNRRTGEVVNGPLVPASKAEPLVALMNA